MKQKRQLLEFHRMINQREYRLSLSTEESEEDLSDNEKFRKERKNRGRQDLDRLVNVTVPTRIPIVKSASNKFERKTKVPHFKNVNIVRENDFVQSGKEETATAACGSDKKEKTACGGKEDILVDSILL